MGALLVPAYAAAVKLHSSYQESMYLHVYLLAAGIIMKDFAAHHVRC
jgi:hypothetical protein